MGTIVQSVQNKKYLSALCLTFDSENKAQSFSVYGGPSLDNSAKFPQKSSKQILILRLRYCELLSKYKQSTMATQRQICLKTPKNLNSHPVRILAFVFPVAMYFRFCQNKTGIKQEPDCAVRIA